MALTVQCSQCKTTLELDEGFRGGVCRCNSCGALVQVPRSPEEGVARCASGEARGKRRYGCVGTERG